MNDKPVYNHSEGKQYVAKKWEKVGVAGVVKGESALSPQEPIFWKKLTMFFRCKQK